MRADRLGDRSLKTSLPVDRIVAAAGRGAHRGAGGRAGFADVEHVTIIYLIPVLAAAIRGGVVPAVISALAAIAAAAFFFYPPIYDFRVHNPMHLVDLVLSSSSPW